MSVQTIFYKNCHKNRKIYKIRKGTIYKALQTFIINMFCKNYKNYVINIQELQKIIRIYKDLTN